MAVEKKLTGAISEVKKKLKKQKSNVNLNAVILYIDLLVNNVFTLRRLTSIDRNSSNKYRYLFYNTSKPV